MTRGALRRALRAQLAAEDADALLCHVLVCDRATLLATPDTAIAPEAEGSVRAMADALLRGEPLCYLTGSAPFFGDSYVVGEGVLIPRADSEVLVEEALQAAPPAGGLLLDLCCGSGCLLCAILLHAPRLRGIGVDVSQKALSYAAENVRRHGLSDRAALRQADVLHALPDTAASLIVCNPPYIATGVIETLSAQVRHEPHSALDGGADGLLFYRTLLPRLYRVLADDGTLLFEIGYDQAQAVQSLAAQAGYQSRLRRDYGGRDRVLILKKPALTTKETDKNTGT